MHASHAATVHFNKDSGRLPPSMASRNIYKHNLQKIHALAKQPLVRRGYYSKPSFIIIGAQKAGTTALWNYLRYHPNIHSAMRKEIHFFAYDHNYVERGEAWYNSLFPLPYRLKDGDITFEASPNTLYYPHSFERIYNYDPSIKIVILLRNPTKRAFSAWNHYQNLDYSTASSIQSRLKDNGRSLQSIQGIMKLWNQNGEFLSFEEAIQIEINALNQGQPLEDEPSLIRKGFYSEQIRNLLEYFPPKQVLILDHADLQMDVPKILDQVVHFLDLPSVTEWPKSLVEKRFNIRTYTNKLASQTEQYLNEFYQAETQALEALLNRKVSWS